MKNVALGSSPKAAIAVVTSKPCWTSLILDTPIIVALACRFAWLRRSFQSVVIVVAIVFL
jgi:hypothetical protein